MKSKSHKNAIKSSNSSGQVQAQHETYEGPIPHPSILNGLQDINKDFPERIFQMAEKEQSHRHKMDEKIMKNHSFMTQSGLIFAFIIALLCISAGLYLLIHDKSVKGFALILTPIATIITASLFKKNEKNNLP